LAPPVGSQPLPRWAWGPLSIPCKSGTPTYKFQIKTMSIKKLAPPVDSQPLPRWAWGPLSVPYKSGTPTYKFQVKTRSGTCATTCPATLPLNQGGLWGCHMSTVSETRLPDRKGSDAAMCIMTPDPLGGPWCAACPTTPDPASPLGGLQTATCHVGHEI
jgi:hypothetical protein